VTWDGSPSDLKKETSVRVWRVMTGKMLRSFTTPSHSPMGTGNWPHFLWSFDGKFLARCSDKELFVYETPGMALLDDPLGKKSTIKYPLEKFSWSPGDNILSIWIPELKDSPGRLLLVEIPSRKEIASKNVYNVVEASMFWQSKGDYVALRTTLMRRTGKKGKKEYTQIEIFRIREKNIPVDTVQIEDLKVKSLHWEEGGRRLAVLGEEETTRAHCIRFFEVSQKSVKRDTVQVAQMDVSNQVSLMKWSPHGTNFILACEGADGALTFAALTADNKIDIFHKDEHFMVNDVKWDASGRYVCTAVTIELVTSGVNPSYFRHQKETGFMVWSFQGRLQYMAQRARLFQFLWRPHPPSLLSQAKADDVHRRLKDYSRRYDVIDDKIRNSHRAEYLNQRKAEFDAFLDVLEELERYREDHPDYADWEAGKKRLEESFNWEIKEEVTEEELDVKETPC